MVLLSAAEEEPGVGGPDRPRPAAERGSESANGQLSDSHSVRSSHITGCCSSPCWRPEVVHSGRVTSATYWPPASLHVFFLVLRQISKEEQDLKVALERQTAMNQNLSQEKEQLMFKLRHRDSYPSIHLPTMVQELAPR